MTPGLWLLIAIAGGCALLCVGVAIGLLMGQQREPPESGRALAFIIGPVKEQR